MSMRPANPGLTPLGQFDVLDTELANITGGEVVYFSRGPRTNTATEQAAADARDGYLYDDILPFNNRPVIMRASDGYQQPLYLADDGTSGYGTHFGSTIGVPAGLSTTGTNLGPHSGAASGKITLWNKPGLYSVSMSSLAADFVATLSPSGMDPGLALGLENTGSGRMGHIGCANVFTTPPTGVARAVEFESTGSLVTTPERLVGAAEQWPNLLLYFHAGRDDRTL